MSWTRNLSQSLSTLLIISLSALLHQPLLLFYKQRLIKELKPHSIPSELPTEREMGREIMSAKEEEVAEEILKWSSSPSSDLPLLSLNHVSFVCKSVQRSVKFYEDVLGFVLIKRPSSFDFEGAWYVITSYPFLLLSLFFFF